MGEKNIVIRIKKWWVERPTGQKIAIIIPIVCVLIGSGIGLIRKIDIDIKYLKNKVETLEARTAKIDILESRIANVDGLNTGSVNLSNKTCPDGNPPQMIIAPGNITMGCKNFDF